jgi:hypothetical protein
MIMMNERENRSMQPVLSIVVAIVSDTTDARCDLSHLKGCLEALYRQIDPPSMEIIIPYRSPLEGIEELRRQYVNVVFIPIPQLKTYTGKGGSREHHDELRAYGLGAARGDLVALLEDHARPDPNWCARIVEAHRQRFPGYAGIGGAIENGIDRPLNWAVYFCDFGRYQNPVPAGDSFIASDANVSYKRSKLEPIRSIWESVFHETIVNWELVSRGEKLALSPDIIVYQHRSNLNFSNAVKERFVWGRSYAATRSQLSSNGKRFMYALLSPLLPAVLSTRMAVTTFKRRRLIRFFLVALPMTIVLLVSWAFGEFTGYLTGHPNSSPSSSQSASPSRTKNAQL